MSVSYNIKLDLTNANNKVDTVYTKTNTHGVELNAEIVSNGEPVDLTGATVELLSNNRYYLEQSDYPHIATISGPYNNIATFSLDDVFTSGWTICTVRITRDGETVAVSETQNFQIFSENAPSAEDGNTTAGSNAAYIPTASAFIKGGVRVGNGLSMTGETMNADVNSEDIERIDSELSKRTSYAYHFGSSMQDMGGYLRFTSESSNPVPKVGDIIQIAFGSAFENSVVELRILEGVGRLTLPRFSYTPGETITVLCTYENGYYNWSCSILEKDTTVNQVRALEQLAHGHNNKSVLDKLSYDNGLKFDGVYVNSSAADFAELSEKVSKKIDYHDFYMTSASQSTTQGITTEYHYNIYENNIEGSAIDSDYPSPPLGSLLRMSFSSWTAGVIHTFIIGDAKYAVIDSDKISYTANSAIYGFVTKDTPSDVADADYGVFLIGNYKSTPAIQSTTVDINCILCGASGSNVVAVVYDPNGISSSLPSNATIKDIGIEVSGIEYRLHQLPTYDIQRTTLTYQINDCVFDDGRMLFSLTSSVFKDLQSNTHIHPVVESLGNGSIYECTVYYSMEEM